MNFAPSAPELSLSNFFLHLPGNLLYGIFEKDLNPLDYAIWIILEAQVNAEAHNSVESLKQAITEAFENLDQGMINRAIDYWPRRLDAVIALNGGHFE
uniref:Uncharacterized protein n=1 Tax=Acrobeloides nanus TaxID=290746 RepID=A0A914CUC3_9BILA